jgi:hypothetical protein
MVRKVTVGQLIELMDEFRIPVTSAYFTGAWVERLDEGRLVLSVKRGKRRVLLRGWVVYVGFESSQLSSGYSVFRFVPNDVVKAGRLCDVGSV